MRYLFFIVFLMAVVITAGCVGDNKNAVVTPTPTPTSPTIISTTNVIAISAMAVSQTIFPLDPFVGTWIHTSCIGNTTNETSKVSCGFQFLSSGNFSYSCAGPSIRVIPLYGKWKNLGNNSYTAMYPDKDHPEQPYGFYAGSYYNFSYNPEFDTLTYRTDSTDQQHQIVWVRLKNP